MRVKELYRLHKDIPRIFHLFVGELLAKSYHRKRLLEYFRMAKALGIKVESLNFSSFALSMHLTKRLPPQPYSKVLGEMEWESGEVMREILAEL